MLNGKEVIKGEIRKKGETMKKRKEVKIPDTPILRQNEAAKYLNVSVPKLVELENLGLIKRHEVKDERLSPKRPLFFYIKNELFEAIRSL